MGNSREEGKIFAAFLKDCPLFCGNPVRCWSQPKRDPPDIQCELEDGRTVGVELTSWLDEQQISSAKRREVLEKPFRQAFRSLANGSRNFESVSVGPTEERLRKSDVDPLLMEFCRLIDDLDKRYESEPGWRAQGVVWKDFAQWPTLKRYVRELDIRARSGGSASSTAHAADWIACELPGEWYSPDSAVDALRTVIEKKIGKYSAKPAGLAGFFLLVHYDYRAFTYNSPVEFPDFGFPQAVQDVSRGIGGNFGFFDAIYVCVLTTDGQKSIMV